MWILGALNFFGHVRGPVEELANVGLVFVIMQLMRIAIGLGGVGIIEFLFHQGAMEPHERKKLASNLWYATYYTFISIWGAYLFIEVTGWSARMELVCSWEPVAVSFGTWRSLHIYHCTQVSPLGATPYVSPLR